MRGNHAVDSGPGLASRFRQRVSAATPTGPWEVFGAISTAIDALAIMGLYARVFWMRRRIQQLPLPVVEGRTGRVRRGDWADGDRVPFPAWHQQMEQVGMTLRATTER